MGFVSPMASAKRRIAPFSTSLTEGLDSRPAALRSTTMISLSARRQIQNADQPRVGTVHERRGVDHRPGRRLVARSPSGDEHADPGVALQLDLVARLRS